MRNCMAKRRGGLDFVALQSMLLQCGSGSIADVTVALLGRFLPRLGPLAIGERPFFMAGFLFGRRLLGDSWWLLAGYSAAAR
jgi:hypothetical protein